MSLSTNQSRNLNFYFDNIFNEKIDYLGYTFNVYKTIYDLPQIKYHGDISGELFEYVKKRKYFILLAIYDEDGRIYLERNIQENLYWALPGGSILKNEDIHAAVRRISKRISADSNFDVSLGEIEPIALVENEFFSEGETFKHFGIAFSARIRNKNYINLENTVGNFVHVTEKELANINRYANREVVKICLGRVSGFKTKFPEKEIATNEKYKFRYIIHNLIVKKFILTPKLKRKEEFVGAINSKIAGARSFIDVSCGDSDLINKIYDLNKFDYAVANDISWTQINTKQSGQKKIIFTNHNAVYLPFKDSSFDALYCGNTLHHIPSREELFRLFEECFRISRKIIFVEIEKPENTGVFPHFLNKYWYRKFLNDVGGTYLSRETFEGAIKEFYGGKADISFSEFKNIQGRYLIAEVEKNQSLCDASVEKKYIEIEEKFRVESIREIINKCIAGGFEKVDDSHECDEYFTDIHGEFVKNRTCLRLRTKGDFTELTFKGKSHSFSNYYAKIEQNIIFPSVQRESYKEILNSLEYYKYVLVDKHRQTFQKKEKKLLKNVSIDAIGGVGNFVEFEILADSELWDGKDKELKDELTKFRLSFSKIKMEKADLPYRDYVAGYILNNVLKKEKLKAIILDFDGTVVPTEKLFFDSFRKASREVFDYSPTIEEYKKYELNQAEGLFEYVVNLSGKKNLISRDDFMEMVYNSYENTLDNTFIDEKFFINFLDSIVGFKKCGFKVGLVTSSKKVFVDKILNHFNVADLFDVAVYREDVKDRKPSPAGYLKAIEKIGLSKDNCLAIEDSIRGVESTKRAGLSCIGVYKNSLTSKDELKKMNIPVFEDLREIALILNYA